MGVKIYQHVVALINHLCVDDLSDHTLSLFTENVCNDIASIFSFSFMQYRY